MDIPQDIIDNVIEAIGDDTHLLKQCSLVSSSFLRPSRKQLFSRISISDNTCQGIHQLLVQNPDIRSFVKAITLTEYMPKWRIILEWSNCTSLLAILQLSLCCLESFSIIVRQRDCVGKTWDWNKFSSAQKDTMLSNIFLLPTVKTLFLKGITAITKVPITFFLHIDHLTTLELHSLPPSDFGDENSSLLTASKGMASVASHTVIDRCVWDFRFGWRRQVHNMGSVVLPYMSRLRFFEIFIDLFSTDDLNIFSFLISSLSISLTSPATLEHLKLRFGFHDPNDDFNDIFYENLRDAYIWSHLDPITSHPTGSRLQRVDINIEYYLGSRYEDYEDGPDKDVIEKSVVDGLPLLGTKGILFVKAVVLK